MPRPLCLIIGHGPGLGAAYAQCFMEAGHDPALLSRSGARFEGRAQPGATVSALACDAADPTVLTQALDDATRDHGPPDVLIYNADLAMFGTLDDLDENQFEQSWRVGTLGLYTAARTLGRKMAARGSGTIIVSGATAALRGRDWTTAFAPTKAAQRVLAQSLAKQLGPKGVHEAYILIDGVIDTADTRSDFAKGKPDDFFIQPDRIADTALMLARQDRSAWTFEIDLRPFGETW
ncbi:SDR family NAD(P)-dependent oxidoreductase [Mameliella alba]|uniref:SDR family NAD(P)-dependent oxidoreductase n=1 Tax=Mameliella alba TaxID=561184 RepID=UPI000B53208C|nr:SDR family NAD(P)-dependent oxidoreductase [Mameliella alba]MBY6118049.1 SDR family NAD(P)-dependent oxidoreductase [Mameliella alba]OWV42210.1 short-chain dehydrogenase [Mameliella alba]OWV63941.1 short-chain dehydrogenase [Mameliella alba]